MTTTKNITGHQQKQLPELRERSTLMTEMRFEPTTTQLRDHFATTT